MHVTYTLNAYMTVKLMLHACVISVYMTCMQHEYCGNMHGTVMLTCMVHSCWSMSHACTILNPAMKIEV